MAKDIIHDSIKNALIKDGWTVTHEPYRITYLDQDVRADLAIADVANLIRKYAPTSEAEPGYQFSYSNTNYVLVAAIIEAVSQQSFEQFMRESLFEPLNMKGCRVWGLLSTDPFPHKASDFHQFYNVRTELSPSWIDGTAGDGAIFCSLEGMLIWDEFWRQGQSLISSELMAELFTRPTLGNGKVSDYGFGWVIEKDQVWHNGSWLGARTYLIRYPKQNLCLVVLDNSANLRIDSIVQKLEKAVLPLIH